MAAILGQQGPPGNAVAAGRGVAHAPCEALEIASLYVQVRDRAVLDDAKAAQTIADETGNRAIDDAGRLFWRAYRVKWSE